MSKAPPAGIAAALGVGAAACVALGLLSRWTLLDFSFWTGWLLAAVLVVGTAPWWLARGFASDARPPGAMRTLLALALACAYLAHAGWHVPAGWIERTLFALFAVTMLALVFTRRVRATPPGRSQRWSYAQLALASALVSLSLFHGVFVHAHGLIAHLFLTD